MAKYFTFLDYTVLPNAFHTQFRIFGVIFRAKY
jgi:hypothetical protein